MHDFVIPICHLFYNYMSTICLFNFRRSGFALPVHVKFMMVAGIGENKSKSFEIVIVIVQNIFLLVMVNFLNL